MRHQFQLSDVGLKLIKSYEGFRPSARQLETGRRVAGYGHAVEKGQSLTLTREEAETLLRADLVPYEALVNDYIFAPISQGQFDALVSLAFNIGTDAFLASDVVSATNNGRVLDAASAFDVWRMSEINGQIYVIDALVRRRTSEKVLFLRPEKASALAPRLDLPPREDGDLVGATTYGPLTTHHDSETGIISGTSDLSAHRDLTPSRRREDGPAGVLTLSEIYDEQIHDYDTPDPDVYANEAPEASSLIAEAAADVSKRLDALIANPRRKNTAGLPDSLIKSFEMADAPSKVVPFTGGDRRQKPRHQNTPDTQQDSPISRLDYMKANQASNDAGETEISLDLDPGYNEIDTHGLDGENGDSAERFIETDKSAGVKLKRRRNPNTLPFAVMCIAGLTLLGASLGAIASGFDSRWGLRGEMASNVGVLIGGMLLLGSVYYVIKIMLRR